LAINVNTVYQLVSSVYLNKLQSGAFTSDQFNSAIAVSNYEILNQRLGLPQDYQVGLPQSRISYQVTSKITDDLRHLITKADIQKANTGYFPYPANYYAFSSLRHRYIEPPKKCKDEPVWQDRRIELLDDGEFTARLESSVIPPTDYYPIANYYSYGIEVRPANINKVKLTYVKIPQTPVWNYTMVNDQPVYDPVGSVDFDYPVSMTNEIAIIILGKFGVNLLMADIVQYSEQIKNKGI